MAIVSPKIFASAENFSGYFVGAGFGGNAFMTDTTTESTFNDTNTILGFTIFDEDDFLPYTVGGKSNLNYSQNIVDYNIMGTAFVGYGMVRNNKTYIGATLGGNFFANTENTAKADDESTSNTSIFVAEGDKNTLTTNSITKITRNAAEPFIDLRLGFLVNPIVLAYLKGGINYNNIEIETTNNYASNSLLVLEGESREMICGVAPCHAYAKTEAKAKKNNNGKVGYRVGAGMEGMLNANIGVAIDYTFSFYQGVSSSSQGNGTGTACREINYFEEEMVIGCTQIPAATAISNNASVTDQQVMAQIIYHLK